MADSVRGLTEGLQGKVRLSYGNKETANIYVLNYWHIVDRICLDLDESLFEELASYDPRLVLLVDPFKRGFSDALCDHESEERDGYAISLKITDSDLLMALNEMYCAGLDAGFEHLYS